MDSRPVSRRQFLGSAAALSAAPLAAHPISPSLPADTARFHFSTPPIISEPPLPPGVARQFGTARFRDLPAARGRFSADSRWLIEYDRGKCSGYELATGRKVQFDTPANGVGWETGSWLVTTDGRLTVAEWKDDDYRVRQFDLPSGAERPPVAIKGRQVKAISSDASTAIVDGKHHRGYGSWGVDLASGRDRWGPLDITLAHPLDPTGTIAAAGVHIGEATPEFALRLLDLATGRTVTVESPDAESRYEVHMAWCTADRRRVVGHILPVKGETRWVATWDAATGRLLGKYEIEHKGRVIGPTADGDGVFVVIGDGYQLAVRDLATGKVARRYEVFEVNDALSGVTPDGRTLLLGHTSAKNDRDGPPIRLLDAATGRLLPQSPDPPSPLTRVWFPSLSTVGAGYRTKADHLDFMLWDMPSGRGKRVVSPDAANDVLTPFSHYDPTDPVSADGRIIRLVAGNVSVFDARLRRMAAVHDDLPTGNSRFWLGTSTVAVVRSDGIHLWDVTDGTVRMIPFRRFVAGKLGQVELARGADRGSFIGRPSADGQVLAFTVGTAVFWIDLNTKAITLADVDLRSGSELRVSADGNRVVWPTATPQDEFRMLGQRQGIPPLPCRFAVHDRDGRKWKVNTETGVSRHDLTGCGRTLVTQTQRGGDSVLDAKDASTPVIELWEVMTGERRWEYPLARPVNDLKASPCGRYFATVRGDTPVYLWDIYGEMSAPKSTPTPPDLPKLWADLGWSGAERSFAAVRTLVQHPAAAVELIGERLKPAVKPKAEWVAGRIARLNAPNFHVRHGAERELAAVVDLIGPELKAAWEAGADTPEADGWLKGLIGRADRPADLLRTVRAVEVLEYAEGKAAADLLAKLADGAEGAVLTREATAALKRRRWRG